MVRWILLLLASGLLLLGGLNVFPVPTWAAWELGILAGEFGHLLAPVAILIAAVAGWQCGAERWRKDDTAMTPPPPRERRGSRWWIAFTTLIVAAVAAAFLFKPALQAKGLGRAVAEQMATRFGAATSDEAVFSFAALAGRNPSPVPVETLLAPGELPLDFYRPIEAPAARAVPCVIVVHGGGWDSGDRKQLPMFNHWLARRGYAVAAISYRLAPQHRWPAQREDVLAAIAFLKSRSRDLGIDSGRFVLLGRSAGGQIAQVVAYTARDSAIRGLIAFYAPGDLYFGYVNTHENDMLRSPSLMRQYLGGSPETARAAYDSASAQHQVSREAPPTLLLHGEIDPIVWHRHSVRLDARLGELGVPRAFVSLPWATHVFDYNLHGPGGQLTMFAVERFLKAVTK